MDSSPSEPKAVTDGGLATYRGAVLSEWIDPNRHMNVVWYDHVFDSAESAILAEIGIDEDFILRTDISMFRLEKTIRYERELLLGDDLCVSSRMLAVDARRVRHFHQLWNLRSGARAATAEMLSIHVDLRIRRSIPFTLPEVVRPLNALWAAHSALPWPRGAGPRERGVAGSVPR